MNLLLSFCLLGLLIGFQPRLEGDGAVNDMTANTVTLDNDGSVTKSGSHQSSIIWS